MATGNDVLEVNKGGESWLQFTIDRRATGVELWAKADPRVEDFMRSLSLAEDAAR